MDKVLIWLSSSRKDLRTFPEDVKDNMGYALRQIQKGKQPAGAKPWKGLGSGVLEILDDFDGNTYRAVYTVRFAEAVYALHCFQKKSKRGIETPLKDKHLVEERLKLAGAHYQANFKTAK